MNLDEAIAHAEEKATGDTQCAQEHRDLAKFLRELRDRRDAITSPITGEEAIFEVGRVGPGCPEEGQELLARLGFALVDAGQTIAYLEGRLGLQAGGGRAARLRR